MPDLDVQRVQVTTQFPSNPRLLHARAHITPVVFFRDLPGFRRISVVPKEDGVPTTDAINCTLKRGLEFFVSLRRRWSIPRIPLGTKALLMDPIR